MRSGFPHSDIAGSKLYCQLPRAFRRLTRPSSPVIAKASTTCTSSLDPITLDPSLERPGLRTKRASCAARARRADTRHPNQCNHTPGTTHRLDALYPLLPIVKEPSKSCLAVRLQVYPVRSLRTPETSPSRPGQHLAWWSWSGSNRRPTACKAAALPAELQPLSRATLDWWVWLGSNQRPPPYQDGALTS